MSAPAPPPINFVLDHRHQHRPLPTNLSAVSPRSSPSGGAVEADTPAAAGKGIREGNWVLKILRVGSLWKEERVECRGGDIYAECSSGNGVAGCPVEEEDMMVFDRETFSRLLRPVSLPEAETYANMAHLGSLAYTIPKIKPATLLKSHGLRFVTSSLDKKAKFSDEEEPITDQGIAERDESQAGAVIGASLAYRIAASAASHLRSRTLSILPLNNQKEDSGEDPSHARCSNQYEELVSASEVASFVATTNSVTAVVAGKKEMRDAVAEDLNSARSSPCEWFICDEDRTGTRYVVIQGSESLASWQTNLLFEPIQFEGQSVLVHRGIYEAAKGIYQQILPEVQAHLKYRGDSATFRFTGHSLGGSLALLVNLMLLIRGDAPTSSLLPVITFGAPSIMCGGDSLLRKLGLPRGHVQSITMHRDIVPRAFSCHYPDHVASILKAVNRNFCDHPCLENQSLLYAPFGKLLILQPEEKFSPHHHLLPPGSGLYLLGHSLTETEDSMKLMQAAQFAFLNSPHPLEILSDHSAYGSEGTILRDHDINAYLRSVRAVVRRELKLISKAKREHQHSTQLPFVSTPSLTVGQNARPSDLNRHHFIFAGVLHGGREALKRFARMVGSRHVHFLFILLFPVHLFVLGTLSPAILN
ncbi:hypothetical protein AXF42_Ash003840 [Apostasia shenzhenica]|uniref:Fungal lipase-type domain-containing protein n=1 Tax=Apostasia shenzhenica TaxID=1088818 RepID=A0A2I0AI19_9ASPA|nr:hypothetical protein AXF42_Ash003840 [Apostasia shenzhenica]